MNHILLQQEQWYAINAKYKPFVFKNEREGKERFREWHFKQNNALLFTVNELMWSDKEWEWLLHCHDSFLQEFHGIKNSIDNDLEYININTQRGVFIAILCAHADERHLLLA